MTTETADLFLIGSVAAAVAALILILRSAKSTKAGGGDTHARSAADLDGGPEAVAAGPPHELLVAWVQFLKSDVIEAVNTLHNRLNVISHAASDAGAREFVPEKRKTLELIKSEGERAVKITTGLLHRVHALAPDSLPPVLYEFDGEKLGSGHILLVENDDANRSVIRKVFERLGQGVTSVKNGYEAFAALEENEPDCIISDVRLPYLDGRTLFEQVEREKPHLASRFVFVTGDYTNPATADFLKETGQPVIGKPYEVEALLGAVAAVLRMRMSG